MKRLSKTHRRTRATATGVHRWRPEVVASCPISVVVRMTVSFLGILIVCCAAIAICTIIAKPQQPAAPPLRAEPITGAAALRPDLVRGTAWPFATCEPRPAQPSSHPPHFPLPQAKPPTPHEPSADPHAGSMEATAEVVTELYARLAEDPAGALGLLAPQLHAGDPAGLVGAWQEVSSTRAQLVEPRPGDVVISEIEADYPNGERVVLRHRITVDWRAHPHIVTVELLTARKFHIR